MGAQSREWELGEGTSAELPRGDSKDRWELKGKQGRCEGGGKDFPCRENGGDRGCDEAGWRANRMEV